MQFDWDPNKERSNFKKHRVAFEQAVELFELVHLEFPDGSPEVVEERWLAVGEVMGRVLVVIYTWRGQKRRIISARKATKPEREAFYRTIQP